MYALPGPEFPIYQRSNKRDRSMIWICRWTVLGEQLSSSAICFLVATKYLRFGSFFVRYDRRHKKPYTRRPVGDSR